MIVPSMTLEEIRAEIEKDYPILYRKSSYLGNKLARKMRLKRGESTFHSFEYTSKYKNTWLCNMYLSRKKKDRKSNFLMYFYGNRGLTALLPGSDNKILYCTTHFFQRYNERRKLGFTLPVDILRSFMEDNHYFRFEFLEEVQPGIKIMFGVTQSGVILGTLHTELLLYKANTFLTNDMLKGDQVERHAQLAAKVEKYLDSSGMLD